MHTDEWVCWCCTLPTFSCCCLWLVPLGAAMQLAHLLQFGRGNFAAASSSMRELCEANWLCHLDLV